MEALIRTRSSLMLAMVGVGMFISWAKNGRCEHFGGRVWRLANLGLKSELARVGVGMSILWAKRGRFEHFWVGCGDGQIWGPKVSWQGWVWEGSGFGGVLDSHRGILESWRETGVKPDHRRVQEARRCDQSCTCNVTNHVHWTLAAAVVATGLSSPEPQ